MNNLLKNTPWSVKRCHDVPYDGWWVVDSTGACVTLFSIESRTLQEAEALARTVAAGPDAIRLQEEQGELLVARMNQTARMLELQAQLERTESTLHGYLKGSDVEANEADRLRAENEKLKELLQVHTEDPGGYLAVGGFVGRIQELEAQVTMLKDGAGAIGHEFPCYYCTKPCNSLAGNPSEWPTPLCHSDEPGKVKYHHIGCVMLRLNAADNLQKEIEHLKPLAALGETNSGRIDSALCDMVAAERHRTDEMAEVLTEVLRLSKSAVEDASVLYTEKTMDPPHPEWMYFEARRRTEVRERAQALLAKYTEQRKKKN